MIQKKGYGAWLKAPPFNGSRRGVVSVSGLNDKKKKEQIWSEYSCERQHGASDRGHTAAQSDHGSS